MTDSDVINPVKLVTQAYTIDSHGHTDFSDLH